MSFRKSEKAFRLVGIALVLCACIATIYLWFAIDLHDRSGEDFWFFLVDSFLPASLFLSLIPISIGVWLILMGNYIRTIGHAMGGNHAV